ncbi:MAG: hypothetical protein IT294_13865 [Deltaproteobacteria bacterium]|nr:hypothetical protein [Deltaproteobacteria bacterium]
MGVRIHLQYAKPQMRLARPITDASGRLVAGVGTVLSPGVVRVLRQMALQSVVVDGAGAEASWERVRTLDEERSALAARFAAEPPTPPLVDIRAAIDRHLERRAATFARGAAVAEGREA